MGYPWKENKSYAKKRFENPSVTLVGGKVSAQDDLFVCDHLRSSKIFFSGQEFLERELSACKHFQQEQIASSAFSFLVLHLSVKRHKQPAHEFFSC